MPCIESNTLIRLGTSVDQRYENPSPLTTESGASPTTEGSKNPPEGSEIEFAQMNTTQGKSLPDDVP
ncbi:uncharacterized protein G2W53_033337 [Senna tora]|uniref:Uncharacterized protein n=1 Tax=Senna tora TaxID=362788 RepID=A0A834WAW8_9FABA|nr:uncharacterized protein G2W53_033337 [Senna tora]